MVSPASKKVLYVCPNGFMGGAERFVIEAARGHLKYGHWHPYIVFFTDGDAVKAAQTLAMEHKVLTRAFRLSQPWQAWRAAREIRAYIRKNAISHVHGTMPYGYIMTWLATLGLSVTRVWFQHGPVGGLLDKIACFLRPHWLLYNSSFLREEHGTYDFLNRHRSIHHIVPYGITETKADPDRVAAIRERYAPEGTWLFLLAGRLCAWKGYELFIQAAGILAAQEGTSFRFRALLVGGAHNPADREYEDQLRSQAGSLPQEFAPVFLGKKTDMANYFAAAHVFFHCSTQPEPFGLVVGEAMSQDTLVVGSEHGGIRDILEEGTTGLTYDTQNPQAAKILAGIMRDLLSRDLHNDPEILKMRRRGKKRVAERFSVPTMTRNLERIYDL